MTACVRQGLGEAYVVFPLYLSLNYCKRATTSGFLCWVWPVPQVCSHSAGHQHFQLSPQDLSLQSGEGEGVHHREARWGESGPGHEVGRAPQKVLSPGLIWKPEMVECDDHGLGSGSLQWKSGPEGGKPAMPAYREAQSSLQLLGRLELGRPSKTPRGSWEPWRVAAADASGVSSGLDPLHGATVRCSAPQHLYYPQIASGNSNSAPDSAPGCRGGVGRGWHQAHSYLEHPLSPPPVPRAPERGKTKTQSWPLREEVPDQLNGQGGLPNGRVWSPSLGVE